MSEIITLRAAAKHAGVSYETVRQWLQKHDGLGEYDATADKWRIDKRELNRIVKAKRFLGVVK